MNILLEILTESWKLLQESSIYVLFGIFVAGLMRVFVRPEAVSRHLGKGKVSSVIKAAALGVPIPLCSCGVLPAAVSLKRQGANNGATTAFLISTPESGVDSIALTYALLDPVMTVARPVAAFTTAAVAGIAENMLGPEKEQKAVQADLSCPVDNCCDGVDCLPEVHKGHHTFFEKLKAGFSYALFELWEDIAPWFLLGLLLAGVITALIPSDLMTKYLGGGLPAMLIMLAVGIPLYICATASTPIAAALILKGVSPGAALVFLLAGPATNVTSLTVLFGLLGKRATAIYLASIAVVSLACGLALDQVYAFFGISAQAVVGQAAEIIPLWAQVAGALALLVMSAKPLYRALQSLVGRLRGQPHAATCDCAPGTCNTAPLVSIGKFAPAEKDKKGS
ncbi:MAG: permease [Deltaproteobacteria bacterium]|nr:permease [Deltaproteobacteria bacterium]